VFERQWDSAILCYEKLASFLVTKTFWFFLVIKRTTLPISYSNKRRDSSAEPVLEKSGNRNDRGIISLDSSTLE